jgi:hypothetical protein
MILLENLDASIARLDMALVRAQALPTDPIAAEELAFCLDTLAAHDLPSGLGPELDDLIGEAVALAGQLVPAMATQVTRMPCPYEAVEPIRKTSSQLRSKLLDIAAAISVLARD